MYEINAHVKTIMCILYIKDELIPKYNKVLTGVL